MPGDIDNQPFTVTTSDGETLHGDLTVPTSPVGAAAVAHPHPLMGGDRHNPVVEALVRSLASAGLVVARFDFRGVGRSTGVHDRGRAERLDMAAALHEVRAMSPNGPMLAVGYSFGADVALSVDQPDVAARIAVAPPLSNLSDPCPAAIEAAPTTILSPAHDQFCPPDLARERTAGWASSTVIEVPGADHFLAGRLGVLADQVLEALRLVGP